MNEPPNHMMHVAFMALATTFTAMTGQHVLPEKDSKPRLLSLTIPCGWHEVFLTFVVDTGNI